MVTLTIKNIEHIQNTILLLFLLLLLIHQFLSLLCKLNRIYMLCWSSFMNYCVQYYRLWHWDQIDGWWFKTSLVSHSDFGWFSWEPISLISKCHVWLKNTHNKRPISTLPVPYMGRSGSWSDIPLLGLNLSGIPRHKVKDTVISLLTHW